MELGDAAVSPLPKSGVGASPGAQRGKRSLRGQRHPPRAGLCAALRERHTSWHLRSHFGTEAAVSGEPRKDVLPGAMGRTGDIPASSRLGLLAGCVQARGQGQRGS